MKFGGSDSFREPLIIDAIDFIAVKSFKAKGKRVTTFAIDSVTEIEPRETGLADEEENPDSVSDSSDPSDLSDDSDILLEERSDDEVRDEINGQERLF
ncbi:MAG: hypothetical protein K2G06_10265 [Muribaculaceae bacterium]|nr:hypothetical protein [Muribaculaceae bacterium]